MITSISRAENSQISVRFKLERAPIRRRPTSATGFPGCATNCPDSVDEPVIAKVEADANPSSGRVFVGQAFGAGGHRFRQPHRQAAPADPAGAADVRIFGDRKFAMRVWLDRGAWRHQLTPADVEDAPEEAERRGAAGRIESRERSSRWSPIPT